MKKTILSTMALIFALVGCSKEETKLKILAPTGAPAVSIYMYGKDDNFTTTSNPATGLIPNFKTNNYDIIIAPTNGGLMQIKSGAEFKIAATITFGNFYIVASGKDEDGVINAGDKILCFQENDIPGLVYKYVYGDLGLDVMFVAGVDATKACIENNFSIKEDETTTIEFDYVFTAEPVLTATKTTMFKNVQEDFVSKSKGLSITQASIFVSNHANKEKVDAFLIQLEQDIKNAINNPELLKTNMEKVGEAKEQQNKFGVTGAVAMAVTNANNGFSLGYKKAKDIKDDIQNTVNLLTNDKFGELGEEVIYQ